MIKKKALLLVMIMRISSTLLVLFEIQKIPKNRIYLQFKFKQERATGNIVKESLMNMSDKDMFLVLVLSFWWNYLIEFFDFFSHNCGTVVYEPFFVFESLRAIACHPHIKFRIAYLSLPYTFLKIQTGLISYVDQLSIQTSYR